MSAPQAEQQARPAPDEAPEQQVAPPSVDAPDDDAVATPASCDQDPKSRRVSLADLSARGAALYAHGNFDDAADVFSQASAMQAELNGETSPENAEILFHYGRSVFKVGQRKSDVLGGPAVADSQAKPPKAAPAAAKTNASKATPTAPDGKNDDEPPAAKKPLFQFTGDENFDGSDDGEDAAAADDDDDDDDEQADEEDDLATAFEILDLARVCYLKQLDQLQQHDESAKGKEASQGDSPAVRHIKERLADTHDCLAEISLENERYPAAIEDGRISLNYKREIYPQDSEIIAEAHYKLSLALEFASVTVDSDDGKKEKRDAMDQGLRDEAIKEMELAIKSFKLKMQATEVELATNASSQDNDLAQKTIAGMKEVAADMEQRLVDLRKDPIDASALLGGDGGANPLGGVLGAVLGESAADAQTRIDEAARTATDLSGLVRKKKAKEPELAANGKRKADDDPAPEGSESPKRAKVDDSNGAEE